MTILEISETVIRGEKALVFPLENHSGRIHDQLGHHVLEIRGWGYLQYAGEEKGAELQDSVGDWIVATLNAAYETEKFK